MKKVVYAMALLLASLIAGSQNTSEKLLNSDEKLSIGGYGQIDFNQKFDPDIRYNGTMDVHRLVLMFGYKFNERTRFVTELEFEHVKEVFVEQAFLDYKLNKNINFRAGLLLIPMGIINEYHEPATFNGVERPNLDNALIPTTWREIGGGITGKIQEANVKYQLYVVNGFMSYNGGGLLRGSDMFRKGRQKGAESVFTNPNFSGKVEYTGISALNIGLSSYIGKTQSGLYNEIIKNDIKLIANADSSVLGLNMVGLDLRYSNKAWNFKAQLNYGSIKNTDEYNKFTAKDLGSAMFGYYLEAGYNLFQSNSNPESKLISFIRYEEYNTHSKTDGILKNLKYDRTDITAGLGWWLASGAVLKADMQWLKNKATNEFINQINIGVGVWF